MEKVVCKARKDWAGARIANRIFETLLNQGRITKISSERRAWFSHALRFINGFAPYEMDDTDAVISKAEAYVTLQWNYAGYEPIEYAVIPELLPQPKADPKQEKKARIAERLQERNERREQRQRAAEAREKERSMSLTSPKEISFVDTSLLCQYCPHDKPIHDKEGVCESPGCGCTKFRKKRNG